MRISTFAIALVSLASFSSATLTKKTKCVKPDIRKEWRTLDRWEKKSYLDAVKCLYTKPHKADLRNTGVTPTVQRIDPSCSLYDDIVYTHMDAVNSAHLTGRFLPWHRHYISTFEDLARKECGWNGTVPYWDWTIDYKDVEHGTIWDADPETGLGLFGKPEDDYYITTGAFANLRPAYPIRHQMRRIFILYPFALPEWPWKFPDAKKTANSTMTPAEQTKMIEGSRGSMTGFQSAMDGYMGSGLHFAAHLSLGGDAKDIGYGVNDPTFWLLHANVDRIWWKWQSRYPENKWTYTGGNDAPFIQPNASDGKAVLANLTGMGEKTTLDTVVDLANLGPNVTVGQLADIKGDYLCYDYAA